jgi:lambda family phage portal protein
VGKFEIRTGNIWETPLGQHRLRELAATSKPAAATRSNRRQVGGSQRMYSSARTPVYSAGWSTSDSSADAELVTSLQTLRSRSRALVRDNSYAKRAVVVIANNVIGTGIGMQAQVMTTRDKLNDRVNDEIEEAWCEWKDAENCHTGGRLQFGDYERLLMAETVVAGDVLTRTYHREFGPMGFPFCLDLIEAERVADDYGIVAPGVLPGNHLRMGIEVNDFYRPQAYYIHKRNRSEIRFNEPGSDFVERVPAESILHLAMIDRWPQTRGEPWFHTAALRLNDMDGYSEAEITRARAQAVRMGIIESGESTESMGDDTTDDGTPQLNMDPATILRLQSGEKWIDSAPNAPNPQLDPFMRYMLREVAAGIGVSYESLSRDYSQSNYSSSRLALLDDRDMWRFFQCWYISNFRNRIHKQWLRAAILSRKIKSISVAEYAADPRKFEKVLFKPRGWTWIDPSKEVDAYIKAVKNGFTTVTDVIAQTAGGMDLEDILRVRDRELGQMRDKGLVFETSPEVYTADAKKADADAKAAKDPPADPPGQTTEEDAVAPPKAGRFALGVVK